ncbi:two-component regulator propeller domain-containing protein [Bernardetia sp. Wsw4-3y2]|uniref:ligand-binding sensor domain-containing protein n=1 Tax=Bernardetia sp. Wsw4-3y2 TaxID=3127471 RepID=UPI0030D559D0
MWKSSPFLFWILIFYIFCVSQKIQAQDYDLAYQHITTENGLSNNFVTMMIQDQKGFIWLGTQEGLNKYDGYAFKIYKSDSETKYHLNSNHITFLAEDAEKNILWIGTTTGLSKLHTQKDTIENVSFFDKHLVNYVSIDENKNVWVATDKGVFKKETSTQNWQNYSFNLDTNQNFIFIEEKLIKGKNTFILVAVTKQISYINHLFSLNEQKKEWEKIIKTPNYLQYIDENGKIWTSYKDESFFDTYSEIYNPVYKIDSVYVEKPKSTKYTHPFTGIVNEFTTEKKAKKIWFGDTGGLILVDLETKKFEAWYYWKHFSKGRDRYTVEMIFKDKSKNYWVCTQGTGVFLFADYTINNFRTYKYDQTPEKALSQPSTRAIYQDPVTKDMWIGTYSNKNTVDIFLGDSIKKTLFINSYVHLIKEDSTHKNILWFATSSGLRKIDKEKFEVLESYRMDNTLLNDILPLNDSTLWIANQYNLDHFNPSTKKIISYPHLKDITHLCKTKNEAIWVGSQSKGIGFLGYSNELNSENAKTITIDYYNPNKNKENTVCYVKCILQSSSEPTIFWIATTTGFYKFDSKKRQFLEHYTEKKGLPNNIVYTILEDSEENLWGSTNHGIFKFNPKTKIFTNFDKQDGLQDNEFNTFSYFKSKEGELFFGGINGVNAFFPKKMKKNEFVPPLHLTSFEKLGKKINFDTPISELQEISFEQEEAKMLTFHFAALSFYQSRKNQYAYKIEPIQKEWIELGTKNELTLTNLAAGNYTLYIKGSNNHGIWNEKGIQLKIKIIPPFYQTLWFQTLLICIFLASVYFYYKLKVRQSKKRAIFLENQVEERTHEIQLQAEELQITNERLKELDHFKEKTTNMLVHDLKNPLGTIIYEAKNNIPIRKASQRMMNLLMALLDSQKIQSPQFQLHLEKTNFDSILNNVVEEVEVFLMEREIQIIYEENSIFWLQVDKDLIERVLVNLLTNAIKYSSKRSFIKISIKENQSNFAQITVTDTGLGIEKHQLDTIFDSYTQVNAQKVGSISSTGLGLSFCKLAVEAHTKEFKNTLQNDRTIWVESVPNIETSFHFIVPLLEIEILKFNQENKLEFLSNESKNKTFSNSNSYQFSETEINYLQPFIKELKNLEVYQATQIRSILNSLNDENTKISEWKEEIQEVLYRVDEDEYQKLLNLTITP